MSFKPLPPKKDKSVLGQIWADLIRAYSSVATAEMDTENNEQAAATEIADGGSSCQRTILHNFRQAEFDNTTEQ